MNTRLNLGQYYGSVLRRANLAGALVSETRHPAHAYLPTHAHKSAYFCCVRRGHYRENYGNRSRECGPLTVAFHPPEEHHSERMADEAVHSMNLEVGHDWLQRVQSAAPALRDPIDCHGGVPAWLAARLYREFRWPDSTSSLIAEGLLLELAAELARSAERPADSPSWLRRVKEVLHERFRENISLATLSAHVGVHPMHLATVFHARVGCTVGEYVRARRIEFAASLLIRAGSSLAEVAAEAGFSDQSHLTRWFKRATGFTPAQYRRDNLR